MYLRFVFLLITQVSATLRLPRREEAWMTAEILILLIRTGQLRSIKIGKLRRISRAWIVELVEQLETGRLGAPGE